MEPDKRLANVLFLTFRRCQNRIVVWLRWRHLATLAHQRVHQAGTRTIAEGERETTQLYLYSEVLRLTGFADVIEERAGVYHLVEYKPDSYPHLSRYSGDTGAINLAPTSLAIHCLSFPFWQWMVVEDLRGD